MDKKTNYKKWKDKKAKLRKFQKRFRQVRITNKTIFLNFGWGSVQILLWSNILKERSTRPNQISQARIARNLFIEDFVVSLKLVLTAAIIFSVSFLIQRFSFSLVPYRFWCSTISTIFFVFIIYWCKPRKLSIDVVPYGKLTVEVLHWGPVS